MNRSSNNSIIDLNERRQLKKLDSELFVAMDTFIDLVRAAVIFKVEKGKLNIRLTPEEAAKLLGADRKYRQALSKRSRADK